jgi:hypothetical protein
VNVSFRSLSPADLMDVAEELALSPTIDTTGIVAYDPDTHETLAVFACMDWTMTSVQVHQVVRNKMVFKHEWLETIAEYVFTKCGRRKMYGLVPSSNIKAQTVNHKIGFTEIVRLEDAYDVGIDYVVMELKRENCPYWKPVNKMAA